MKCLSENFESIERNESHDYGLSKIHPKGFISSCLALFKAHRQKRKEKALVLGGQTQRLRVESFPSGFPSFVSFDSMNVLINNNDRIR